MDRRIAPRYIRENFQPSDRLAVVLLNKRSGSVTQRIGIAERIAAPEFQSWLRLQNAQRHEIYISMNALRPSARGRTKADIETIRHVYLDFDENGTEAVGRLLSRADVPTPNYRISTSPGKWQVIWKVEIFTPEQAERLQQGLARETGADPAATDSSRVLRLPGFYNHKYAPPYLVSVEALSHEVYRPERFPKLPSSERAERPADWGNHSAKTPGHLSQSERDWAYAKRALARGEPEEIVVAAIASFRRSDKHDPQDYAERTVRKASDSLTAEAARGENAYEQPER